MGALSVTYASCLFLWANIFQPLSFAKNPGAFGIAWYVLYVLIGAYVLGVVRGQFRPQMNFYIGYVPIYLVWIWITAMLSPLPGTMDGFVSIVKYIAPLILISSALSSPKDIRLVTIVLTLSVGVWSAQAGVIGLIKGVTKDMGIPGGQMTDNNDFMAATVSIIPVLVYLSFSYVGPFRKSVKAMGILMTSLSLCAIVFSNSRGAALGLVAVLLLYLAFVSKRRIREGLLVGAVVGATLFFLPQSFWDRMSTIEIGAEQTESSASERLRMMKAAWVCTKDHPVFGVGPDGWLKVAFVYGGAALDPHNIWLKLASEIGIPGLLLYLVIPGYTLRRLMKVRTLATARGDKDTSAMAVALAMAILGYLMPSSFLSHPFSEFLWAWYGIGNAYAVTCLKTLESGRPGGRLSVPQA